MALHPQAERALLCRAEAILAACLLLSGLGCGVSMLDIQLASKAQKQEHHELIRILQPRVDRKEPVPSAQLIFLAGAYAETRDYGRLFPVCDLWESQIRRGDDHMFAGELSADPPILRANAYLDLGDPVQALGEARRAEAILAKQSYATNAFLDSFRIEAWGALGVAQAQLHHPDEARDCLRRLEGVPLGVGINGPAKHAAIAKVNMALGQFDKALAAVQDPKAEYHGIASLFYDHTFQVLPLAYIQAKCQFETGRAQEARASFDALLKHPRLAEIGGLHWPVLLDRARLARGDGLPALAEDLLRRAIGVVELQRASIGTEAGRIGFVGEKQACYQELVDLLVREGRPLEAFEFVERAKGRALVDLLASQKQLGRGAELDPLDRTEQGLQAIADPAAPHSRGIAMAMRRDLQARSPELASLAIVPEVKAAELQVRLGPDETLLEYYAAGGRWLAFVVTRAGVTATALEAPDLEGAVRDLRRALSDPSKEAGEAASRLYRILVEPVAAQLKTSSLTLVPHGVLHYVPFCALGAGETRMLDRFNLRVLPSATVLAFLKPRKGPGASLILGNPDLGNPDLDLPFAQEEAAALSLLLPQPVLRVRKEATAGEVKASAGRYAIIHLAAHGSFDDAFPLESALYLAAAAGERGTLKVTDLYRLDLDADLVTLSACETALSSVSRGDDVVGFTRGLLFAGARSVLSSLWKVDDACTKELMVDFYGRLGTEGKAEALDHAQRAVRARHPHPYYWAAFMLTGKAD